MNEQNRLRLQRITARHAKRFAQGRSDADADAAFLEGFGRVSAGVIRPVFEDVGAQLVEAGYGFRVDTGGEERSPFIALHVEIPGRGESRDAVRFFARKYPDKGWQVIAELELVRPVELTRFNEGEPLERDVIEHMVVEALEQMFASSGGRR